MDECKVSGVVGLVSGDGDSVRTRRGELASRRKASEASRKFGRLKFQRFCRVVRRCDEVALTKRLMGECAAATKKYFE